MQCNLIVYSDLCFLNGTTGFIWCGQVFLINCANVWEFVCIYLSFVCGDILDFYGGVN